EPVHAASGGATRARAPTAGASGGVRRYTRPLFTRTRPRSRRAPKIPTAAPSPCTRPSMKIQQVKTQFVRLPVEEPLVGAPPMPHMQREFVTVQLFTDDGIEGIGVTGFGGKLARSLKAAVEDFGELIKGDDPIDVEAIVRKLKTASSHCGP